MSLVLSVPMSKGRRYFSSLLIVFFVIFFSSCVEKSLRKEGDLLGVKKICGNVQSYHFSEPGLSIATWRMKVMGVNGSAEVFKVGDKYIHSPLSEIKIKKGDSVCIEYLMSNLITQELFISQIFLNSKPVINKEMMIKEYMKPVSFLNWFLSALFLSLLLILCLKKSR
ncbi:hypothetical protein [uncultured Endozoicomonas sp.]|uniref:hypothetical protein n=1 Tax=uncultured Endozoicomonas sp. TaxID=432652 RepID=UPI00262A65B1|nr:hypothetical protein [uncultured Endozoicomonas sp.]